MRLCPNDISLPFLTFSSPKTWPYTKEMSIEESYWSHGGAKSRQVRALHLCSTWPINILDFDFDYISFLALHKNFCNGPEYPFRNANWLHDRISQPCSKLMTSSCCRIHYPQWLEKLFKSIKIWCRESLNGVGAGVWVTHRSPYLS